MGECVCVGVIAWVRMGVCGWDGLDWKYVHILCLSGCGCDCVSVCECDCVGESGVCGCDYVDEGVCVGHPGLKVCLSCACEWVCV